MMPLKLPLFAAGAIVMAGLALNTAKEIPQAARQAREMSDDMFGQIRDGALVAANLQTARSETTRAQPRHLAHQVADVPLQQERRPRAYVVAESGRVFNYR